MTRRWSAPLVLAVCSTLAVGVTLPANAEPNLQSARAQAQQLSRQVTQLEDQAEAATERYNGVSEQLQQVVNKTVLQQQVVDASTSKAQNTDGIADGRVRALYMSGGSMALYASVLDSGSIGDAISRVDTVNSLVDADQAHADSAWQSVAKAEAARSALADLSIKRTKLENAAQASRANVVNLLQQRQRALSRANDRVVALAEELRLQQEEAAAAAAQLRIEQLPNFDPGAPYSNPYAATAIAFARTAIGLPYEYAGSGPSTYDCSGLVQTAYRRAGLGLPRVASQQYNTGPHVALQDLQPGDLIFWAFDLNQASTIHHVAIYIGRGRMLEAPHTGAFVRDVPMYLDGYFGATRPGLS